jgi:hypothetical protein
MAAALVFLADAASEGIDVIRAMLIVGLVFVAVIVLGELAHWWASTARRHSR